MSFPTSPPVWQDASQASVDVQLNSVWTQAAVDAICEDLFFLLGADGKSPTAGIPVRLGDTTLGAPATSITFSSIPATFKHLRLEVQSRGDGAATSDQVLMQFNADTGANYDQEFSLLGNATYAGQAHVGQTSLAAGYQAAANATRAATAGVTTISIPNYAGTTFEKSFHSESVNADSTAANNNAASGGGSWRNTAAITSIKLFSSASTNFVTGTRATLYGWN